jgi:hypothetical protein
MLFLATLFVRDRPYITHPFSVGSPQGVEIKGYDLKVRN